MFSLCLNHLRSIFSDLVDNGHHVDCERGTIRLRSIDDLEKHVHGEDL